MLITLQEKTFLGHRIRRACANFRKGIHSNRNVETSDSGGSHILSTCDFNSPVIIPNN